MNIFIDSIWCFILDKMQFSKRFFISLCLLFCLTVIASAINWSGNWIWQSANGTPNTWLSFRKTFVLSNIPLTAIANIGVDSKYWLWINGELVVFEGGAGRGPSPGNTWYDVVDIKQHLKMGTNTIAVLVWYFGRSQAQHIDSKKGGLVFQANMDGLILESDKTWKMRVNTAYDPSSGGGGGSVVPYSVKYDANVSLGEWTSEAYDDSSWANATEKGVPPCAPWNSLERNYVPSLKNHGLEYYENYPESSFPFTSSGKTYTLNLPFNKQFTPYLEVECASGQNISIKAINLGTDNLTNSITASYISKLGNQSFESYSWMNGQSVNYTIPAGVIVKSLKYRWTSIGDTVGLFECSDNFYQKLWWMGRNTLFVCARDNFMDCPDRERTLWIGDVADQCAEVFYSMDSTGRELMKKAIRVTMSFRNAKVFGGGAPGWGSFELPSQSLQFISDGVWQYYINTGDVETLQFAYPAIHDYLTIYNMGTNGLVEYRKGAWDWNDWGAGSNNGVVPDQEIMQNCQYYLALKCALKMANVIGNTSDISWYNSRIWSIENNFNLNFWNGKYYCTGNNKEDRANAWAIISGLADSTKYASIVSNVLIPVMNASPHIEWMIEEAMCLAGQPDKALIRMKQRYEYQVNHTNHTTLNELFGNSGYLGTYNHAWNAPNTVLSRDICGIAPDSVAWSTYHIFPQLVTFTSIKSIVPTVKGNINFDFKVANGKDTLNLISPNGTIAIVGIPKNHFALKSIIVNGQLIWNGKFQPVVSEIKWNGEDEKYIKFNVSPGSWQFISSSNDINSISQLTSSTVKIFPNPVTNMINIEDSSQQSINVEIFDMLGKLRYKETSNENTLSIPTEKIGGNGTYLFKVNKYTQKISILK